MGRSTLGRPEVQPEIRCLRCGEHRLIEVDYSRSRLLVCVVCQVCANVSLIAITPSARTCVTCGGMGSHEDGCAELVSAMIR